MKRSSWTDVRIDEKMGAIDSTFDMLREELHGLREDNREQISGLRQEIGGLRQEVRSEIGGLRQEFGGLRQEVHEEIAALRLDGRDQFNRLHSDFASLQTTLVQIGFGMVGVLLAAMVALVVALA